MSYKNYKGRINILYIGERLDKTLSLILPIFSREEIKFYIKNGFVKINGEIIYKPSYKITSESFFNIKVSLIEEFSFVPQNICLDIIYEDNDILVINKPFNLVVHPGANCKKNTLLNALLYHFPKSINIPRAGIVHRLDKNTTGLMVIAKNINSYEYLVNSIKLKNVVREYEAIVSGLIISGGTINKPISRNPYKRNIMCVNKNGKLAITHYSIIERFKSYTRIKIMLETGRTHQIRVHMSYIKNPLIGDLLYGGKTRVESINSINLEKKFYDFNRQALHSKFLSFNHPLNGNLLKFYSVIPKDLQDLIFFLKND